MKKWLSLWILLLISGVAFSQTKLKHGDHKKVSVLQVKDSLPVVELKQVNIYPRRGLFSFWKRWRLSRLIYNVKKVYPYAKTAGKLLEKYNKELENVKSKSQRRKIMKKAEDQLKAKYGHQLEQLNFAQGIILIKLIDRETRKTSYSLVKELRGGFVAFFYQGLARIWGYNLKVRYQPNGRDRKIEAIVKLINEGKI